MLFVKVIFFIFTIPFSYANFRPPPRQYYCYSGDNTCQPIPPFVFTAGVGKSLEMCRLTCGKFGSLWPKPTGPMNMGPNTAPVDLNALWLRDLSFVSDMSDIFEIHKARIKTMHQPKNRVFSGKTITVTVEVRRPFQRLQILQTDESYALRIWSADCNRQFPPPTNSIGIQVTIVAESVFGARHALETLSQLIVFDYIMQKARIVCDISIQDQPKFAYRGLLLDVARNFYPTYSIRHLIDSMSYNKFNVLHLHLTDTNSFPVQIRSWPNMTAYGAYGPAKIYTQDDLKELVRYAYLRGITILPEIDSPAHVAYGWQWTQNSTLGQILMCLEKQCFGSPCGILNPVNSNTYAILREIYRELLAIFGDRFDIGSNFFHIGADEVDFKCWKKSPEISAWLQRFGLQNNDEGMFEVWSYFEKQAMKVLTEANEGQKPRTIIWSSELTKNGKLANHLREQKDRVIVEYWDSSTTGGIKRLVAENFDVIVANYDAWYLDCGVGSYVGEGPNWCKFSDWRTMYNNQLYSAPWGEHPITNPTEKLKILGGEGCAWSEMISAVNMDQKIWPRAAAIAERLWSDPKECWFHANGRFMANRDRMVEIGVAADVLEPEWCTQNENYCIVPPTKFQEYGIASSCPEFNRTSHQTRLQPIPTSAKYWYRLQQAGNLQGKFVQQLDPG